MPEAPGVKVLETTSGPAPAVGLPSAVAGIVGAASWGPKDQAILCTSWPDWERNFGGLAANVQCTYDVFEAYRQGLRDCYFVRVADGTDAASTATIEDRAATPAATLRVDARYTGTFGDRLSVQILDATLDPGSRFRLRVLLDGIPIAGEDYNELTIGAGGTVESTINGRSAWITVTDLDSASAAPSNRPAIGTYALSGGSDGAAGLTDARYIGGTDANGVRTGLDALVPFVDEIGTVLIPGQTGQAVEGALIAWASKYYFPLALLDGAGAGDQDVKTHRGNLGQSSFAAYYYNRPVIQDPLTGATDKLVSLSAVMAGYIARSDAMNIGPGGNPRVHKAPANNPPFLPTILGLERQLDEGQIGACNDLGINVPAVRRAQGVRMMGARTLASDVRWRYVNVRRVFQFVARSLKAAFADVPQEPNYTALWDQMKRSARGLLDSMVRDGMLQGPEGQGYVVVCDETNNPRQSRDAGNLYFDVGLAVVRPAEFVWLRFAQFEGQTTVQQSGSQASA